MSLYERDYYTIKFHLHILFHKNGNIELQMISFNMLIFSILIMFTIFIIIICY